MNKYTVSYPLYSVLCTPLNRQRGEDYDSKLSIDQQRKSEDRWACWCVQESRFYWRYNGEKCSFRPTVSMTHPCESCHFFPKDNKQIAFNAVKVGHSMLFPNVHYAEYSWLLRNMWYISNDFWLHIRGLNLTFLMQHYCNYQHNMQPKAAVSLLLLATSFHTPMHSLSSYLTHE